MVAPTPPLLQWIPDSRLRPALESWWLLLAGRLILPMLCTLLLPLMSARMLRQGICGQTTLGGDCDRGNKGAFGLHPRDAQRGWAAAAQACFALCARCMRCNHITLSLQNLDCSWYSECDSLSELHGYRSAPFAASGLPKVNLVRSLPAAEPIHVVTTGNASSDYDTFVHTLAAALRARPLRPLRAETRSMVAESSLDYFLREKASNATHGVWAEFGVFKGASIRKIVHRHSELAAAPAVVHGFDSFRGLPERWDMGDGHWNPGAGSFHVGGRPPFFDDRIRWHLAGTQGGTVRPRRDGPRSWPSAATRFPSCTWTPTCTRRVRRCYNQLRTTWRLARGLFSMN